MARMRFNHNTFSMGIISKKVQGNTDIEGYNNSLDECVNFQIQHTGGCFKRGGTYFIGETKKSGQARLIPFVYSTDQSYICEFGIEEDQNKGYIRFYTRYGVLSYSNQTFELETPFTNFDDINNLKYYQNGNTLYLLTDSGIFSLVRNEEGPPFSFNATAQEFKVMPLTFINSEKIALKPDNTSGVITFTPVDADKPKKDDGSDNPPNDKFAPVFFDSDKPQVNQIRDLVLNYLQNGEFKTIFLRITDVIRWTETNFNKIVAQIDEELSSVTALPNNNPVTMWQISALSKDRGWPKAVAIYEGRQFLANNKSYPLGIWGSSLLYQDWFNFLIGSDDGDSVQNITSMDKADEILWLIGKSKLFLGTRGGVYICGAASYNDEAISPSSFRIRELESIGASSLQPISAMDTVFFIDSSGRNVHQIMLSESGAYQAFDLSLLANDLTQSGIIAHTWQQVPIKTYWCAVNDGYLCALTYLKNNNILAWTKHVIAGKNVRVTSLATIQEERNDYVWMVVQREIDGEIKRYIEYMHPMYDPMGQEEFKQFYVDSGITKQDKYTIDRIITMDTYETSFATSKSKNARVSYDMTSLRSVHGYKQDYLFCFHIENTETTPFFANGRVFLAKNVTDYACDLFFDTRYASAQSAEPNLYKKINPFDYLEYTLPSDVVACVKFSDVQSVESTLSAPTFVKCEIEGLNVNDKVMICHSGIMVRDITSSEWVSIDGKWWSIRIDMVRKGVLLYWPDTQNPCESNLNALDTRAEIYKTFAFVPNTYIFTTVSALHFGTNCVIEVNYAIPGTVLPMKKVYVNKVVGTTEINQKDYLIAWISGSRKRLVLYDLQKSPEPHPQSQNLAVIDSSGYSEYDVTVENNGNLYLYFETVEGLNHLVGQEIILCVDGNKDARKNIVVPSTGTIALSNPAMYCSAGLKMKSFLKLVPFSGGSVLGSSQGTVGSQKDMAIYLYNSLGGRYGAEADETYSMSYQYKKNTLTDHTQNLFTGLIKLPLPNAKNIYNRTIYIEHDEPTSFNILSITHEISVSDS